VWAFIKLSIVFSSLRPFLYLTAVHSVYMYVGCRSDSRETKRENKFLQRCALRRLLLYFWRLMESVSFFFFFFLSAPPSILLSFFCCTRQSLPSYSTLFIFSKTQAGIIFCFGSEFNFFFVALTNIVSCVMYARRLCRTVCYSASMLDMYFLLKELFRKVGQGK
jgi:hypothetical protein